MPAYRNYSSLVHHKQRFWEISQVSLVPIGGLDIGSLLASLAIAGAGAIPVWVIFTLADKLNLLPLGIPPFIGTTVVAVVLLISCYLWLGREGRKNDPMAVVDSWLMRRIQPATYTGGVAADFLPTRLKWQVVLWRPTWAKANLGPLTHRATYNPVPVGDDLRHLFDPTGAGALVGWHDITHELEQHTDDVN